MSEKHSPIVPHIFTIGSQKTPYQAAPLTRYQALYHTQITVRGQPESGKAETIQQTNAYCLADAAARARAQAAHAALRDALAALEEALRSLGSYRARLKQAGGIKQAPNPLSPTVISIDDPDNTARWWLAPLTVPRIERIRIERHTPEMLREAGKDYTGRNQRDHTLCPTDEDWQRVAQLHGAATQAQQDWEALLSELGTYAAALADGRYAQRVPTASVPAAPTPPSPRASWPGLAAPLLYGHHRSATSGGTTHVWQPAPKPRSKDRHTTLCGIVMTEPPRAPDWSAPGLRLCAQCRAAAERLAAGRTEKADMVTVVEEPSGPVSAVAQLRAHGWTIRPHGLHWLCAGPGEEKPILYATEALIAVAALVARVTTGAIAHTDGTPDAAILARLGAAADRLRALGWTIGDDLDEDGYYPAVGIDGELFPLDANWLLAAATILEEQPEMDMDRLSDMIEALDLPNIVGISLPAPAPVADVPTAPTSRPRLITTHEIAETDLDEILIGRLQDEGYTWQSATRTPDGRWHHLVRRHGGNQRRMRRERLEALIAPAGQLAIVEPAHAGVLMMDAAEARECLSAIRSDLAQAETAERSARQKLLDWKEREGWRALGYASFVAGVQAEIGPWGKAHIYRLLGAAQIERILGLDQSPMGDSEVPERQLRELLPLLSDPQAVRAAWQRASDLAHDGERTARHVQQAVAEQQVPILRVTDAALFAVAEPTISCDLLANGGNRIRKPFTYAGRLWIGVGGGPEDVNCVAVVRAGESYAPGEHNPRYRRGAYTDQRAQQGSNEWILTGQWLIVTRPKPPAIDLPVDLARAGATIVPVGAGGVLQIQIAAWRSSAQRNVAALVAEARSHLDEQALAAVRKILADLPTWDEAQQQRLWQEAYAQARAVRDEARRQVLFAEIDRAADGKPTDGGPVPPESAPISNALVNRAAAEILAANRDNGAWQADQPRALLAPTDVRKEQVRARVAALLRSGFRRLEAETIVLRLLALAICDRDQRVRIADMPRAELEDLLLGRLFAHAWSGDNAPLLALLGLGAEVPAEATSAPTTPESDADTDEPNARLLGLLLAIEQGLSTSGRPRGDEAERLRECERELIGLAASLDDAAYEALSARVGAARRVLQDRLVGSEVAA